MDPIATATFMSGEPARLLAPVTEATYDPTQSADYDPGTAAGTDYRGFQSAMELEVTGATMAFTIQTTTEPVGLMPKGSRLFVRGALWVILKSHPRYYIGRINGFTLYLGA